MKRFALVLSAALLSSTAAFAQYVPPGRALPPAQGGGVVRQQNAPQKPVIRICTGSQTGVYFYASQALARFGMSFQVQPVLTAGSLENVQKVTEGACDLALTQDDSLRVYRDLDPRSVANTERLTALYDEYVHLLCNRESGVTKLSHLRKGHVVAIGQGSGSESVWQALVATDKEKYGQIETSPKSGTRALMAVADGSEVTCTIQVGGLGFKTIKEDAQQYADKIVLVHINEGVDEVKDAKGKSIYTYKAIPNGTYGKLMPSGVLIGTKDAQTFTVKSVAIANTTFADQNARLMEDVLTALRKATPMIEAKASDKL